MFLTLFRNILCPQQMFLSLRSPRNIVGNNVSATMYPRLPGPERFCEILTAKRDYKAVYGSRSTNLGYLVASCGKIHSNYFIGFTIGQCTGGQFNFSIFLKNGMNK